ncbi:ankyrin protein 3 [Fusarium pseudocircinatum]|uniref:Ankyrin protein 3 n=1 Tax=Fusarium pseudocircinatum TaxID=56676 RepID=A0A8H5PW42_9HYPO|nr:ankyrin protein 3 [Fusarium pseudocircinatum]
MERRRLSHGDEGTLPYHAKRRKVGFQQVDDECMRDRYAVAWICALHIEMAAARAMLDEEHADCPRQANDTNSYVLGSIQNHNVVIACLPTDQYGTNNAASVLSNMRRTFPNIEIGLMVGIGGGVPLKADIRLGDIVVGVRVMQYDMGKTVKEGFQRTGVPKIPDSAIRTVISNLRSRHELNGSRVPLILREKMGRYAAYSRPSEPDRLFLASYHHDSSFSSCDECDSSKLEKRKMRLSTDPAIYYGGIGSANALMKDLTKRDEIARELDVLCFEMEAAGLMDIMPCLPIRGICDYSDSHKSKEWQRYAAATAAAYAYEFLELWKGQASYINHHQSQFEQKLALRHEQILKSLDFEQSDARKLTIEAAHSKTCFWFLNHPDYLSWIDSQQISQHHGFLWIRGKPGAGKSTIMKFIYLVSRRKDGKNHSLTASFFFNARGELLEKTVTGMYRSLLLQLFRGYPDLECVLDDQELVPRSQIGCPPLNVLKDLLRAAVAKLGPRPFVCFIDALDECDEQQVMDLIEYFESLAEQCTADRTNLRICFSSRHYPYIDIKFGMRIILEQQIGHTGDLKRFIMANLRIENRSLLTDLLDTMLKKAAGVFLWVVLVVSILNKESRRGGLAMKMRLQEIPSGLSDLFKDLLKRDTTNMEDFQLSLFWILLSDRPLSPEEYHHAIWSGLYMKGLADPDIPEVDTWDSEGFSARCVISSSKGLAEIIQLEQPRVQFIHESIRDFLIKDRGLQEIWPELGLDWEGVGHDRLKGCCHSYFQLVTRKLQIENSYLVGEDLLREIEAYPFLEYASQSVLHHANFASNTDNQQSFLRDFPTSVWKRVVNAFEDKKYTLETGLFYILADRGHSTLIQTRLKSDANIYVPSEKDRYVYPLIAAMARGDKASILALLRLPSALYEGMDVTEGLLPNVDADGFCRTPLSWSCENGHFGIARVLVEIDAQPTNMGGELYSPLMLASMNGHINIARWLLSRGANINERYKNDSAISLAISNGHAETIEFLLKFGADPNTYGINNEPLIFVATRSCNLKLTKLLLQRGANPRAENSVQETPLHCAAKMKGTAAIMEALLSYRAQIDARDDRGRTPLILASTYASIDEIRFLILKGAVATSRDEEDETCLHQAMKREDTALEVVLLLLENGVRADARSRSGQTCLHTFARRGAVTRSTSNLIQLVTNRGTDLNDRDNDGNTPLHIMTKWRAWSDLSEFADLPGLDLNARNRWGKTPLHIAASTYPFGIAELNILIQKGVDVNSLDNDARTPLDYAMSGDHIGAIRLLIENGGKQGIE